jgi:hypothetical protein
MLLLLDASTGGGGITASAAGTLFTPSEVAVAARAHID